MSQPDVSDLFRALVDVGTVEAVRQRYRVFRSVSEDYVVFSPSNRGTRSYHMAVVSADKVDAVYEAMEESRATTGSLMKDKKLGDAFGRGGDAGTRFDVLMALYVLTARGKVAMEKEGRTLAFRKTPERG